MRYIVIPITTAHLPSPEGDRGAIQVQVRVKRDPTEEDNMDRMEHFHGKLCQGERILAEGIDGYLGFHARPNGIKSWFGYFEMPSESCKAIDPKSSCKLVLDDGRAGEIFADFHPSNHPGQSLAEFHISATGLRK